MREDIDCTNAYRQYLRHTIEVLDIKLVVSLGHAAAWFLGPLISAEWTLGRPRSSRDVRIKKHLDQEPINQRGGVVLVNATHPARWDANTKRRGLEQYGGEIGLLIHARKIAGIAATQPA